MQEAFSVLPKQITRELRKRLRPQDVINLTESRYYLHWYRPLRTIFSNIEPISDGVVHSHNGIGATPGHISKSRKQFPFKQKCHFRDIARVPCAKSPLARRRLRAKIAWPLGKSTAWKIYIKMCPSVFFFCLSRCSLVFVSCFLRAVRVTLKKKENEKTFTSAHRHTDNPAFDVFSFAWRRLMCERARIEAYHSGARIKPFGQRTPLSKERRWVAPNICYSFMELLASRTLSARVGYGTKAAKIRPSHTEQSIKPNK